LANNSLGISKLFVFFLTLSCQGPWSYWPENPENYQGIWTYAYIVSGRPVEEVCFDKLHSLDETRMPGFAFYESASVKITGSFNGGDTSFFLNPNTQNFINKPNCFTGPENLLADIGGEYEIDISIAWDSAGKRTVSNYYAKTYIPQKFKIQKAYDLYRKQRSSGDTFIYLPPPMDMQSSYFIPKYSDDVGGVWVSMVYGKDVYWGENSIDKIIGQFSDRNDTVRHAKFGDRAVMYSATNRQIANANKDIDSIPIIGMNFPAIGNVKLLFYATTPEFMKYRDTHGSGDSRTKAIYNIQGGAGIFAGMLVDTFEINMNTVPSVKTYQYEVAQIAYCYEISEEFGVERLKERRQCLELWDRAIWDEIYCGKPAKDDCNVKIYPPWYDIPPKILEKMFSVSELVTWCEHRNFPIKTYPLCGVALIDYSRAGKKSVVLDKAISQWCEENKDYEGCKI
jgi:hypothetical protein